MKREELDTLKPEAWTAIDSFVWPHIAANLIREQHAEIERLRAVALQAQNAAIDLAKQPRTTADDARELLIITGAIRETPLAMPCAYPHCCDKAGNRCPRMFAGQCSGPRAADPQQVGR